MKTLAIDFGNTNTVLAFRESSSREVQCIDLPGISEPGSVLIPSMIHYGDGQTLIGSQVIREEKENSYNTFRWMKRYIGMNSPYHIRVNGEKISAKQAAEEFLSNLIRETEERFAVHADELVFSVPVESFEYYANWLISCFTIDGFRKVRIVDEAVSAAAGYGLKMHPGEPALFFDFGGSTMQATVVLLHEPNGREGFLPESFQVIGKSGCSIGGSTVDRWIFEEALMQNRRDFSDPVIHRDGRIILAACEQLKERLSFFEEADLSLILTDHRKFTLRQSREDLETLLRKRGLFQSVDAVVRDALLQAADHGIDASAITAVIPVGGGSMIPAIRSELGNVLRKALVLNGDPMTAVAKGAINLIDGFGVLDFVRHQYAVRIRDGKTGEFRFHTIIQPGTPYPSDEPVTTLKIKASRQNQSLFGLAIYEISQPAFRPEAQTEIFFDEEGAIRLFSRADSEKEGEDTFWLNEHAPLFLHADPPAEKGIARFKAEFKVDRNKMLLITVYDLSSGLYLFEDYPIIRLN